MPAHLCPPVPQLPHSWVPRPAGGERPITGAKAVGFTTLRRVPTGLSPAGVTELSSPVFCLVLGKPSPAVYPSVRRPKQACCSAPNARQHLIQVTLGAVQAPPGKTRSTPRDSFLVPEVRLSWLNFIPFDHWERKALPAGGIDLSAFACAAHFPPVDSSPTLLGKCCRKPRPRPPPVVKRLLRHFLFPTFRLTREHSGCSYWELAPKDLFTGHLGLLSDPCPEDTPRRPPPFTLPPIPTSLCSMSCSELPTEKPDVPTYSNLGEIRAHLLPSKASRLRTPGSISADLKPPPLPKKSLTRTQSLPTHGTSSSSPTFARQPRRPLLASHNVDKSQEEASNATRPDRPGELTLSMPDAELGHLFQDLHSPEAVHTTLAAHQLASLSTIYTRLRTRLMGGRPGSCHPGHDFRLLDNSPYVDSGEALYYRVVRVEGDDWHSLAVKVPKPGAEASSAWGLELQASLSPHFNLQSLCGLMPECALPSAPWDGPVALVAEVPERTVAQWLADVGARRPPDLARATALLLLQLSSALELLEEQGAVLAELRPENLLLATPRGCAATGLPRLLLADFGRVRAQPSGSQGAHALPLGRLLRELLGPAATPTRPAPAPLLAAGLEQLAAQLPRRRPSAARTRGALQALLWGPGPSLRGHRAPLGPWLRVRRAQLTLHLAEQAAGGEAPGLEDWLCCEYLVGATEGVLADVLTWLWD
ncbi:protein PEAK3 [Rhynchocyon petersi]